MTNTEAIKMCINKELELYGTNMDTVEELIDSGFFKDVPWYQYYTFNSEQEFNEWKEFCINLFRKELQMTKQQAHYHFAWLNLSYGLKQDYEVKI